MQEAAPSAMKKVRDTRKGDRTPWWTALSDARLEPDYPLPVLDNDGSIG